MKKETRNSNVEILRIVSLLLIIFGHFTWHTHWNLNNDPLLLKTMIHSFWIGGKLGVDIFVLISGYYLVNSYFKPKSFIRTWLIAYFYAIIILFGAIISGVINVGFQDIVKTILMGSTGYISWFVTAYLIMYLLSPFINVVLRALSRNQYRMLLIVFILISSLQTVFHNTAVGTNGYDASWLLIIYTFGAYIRLYPSDFEFRKLFYSVSLLVSLMLSVISVGFLDYIQDTYLNSNNPTFYARLINGTSPVQLFSAVMIFLLFIKRKPFTNARINRIASTTFAIYLMHDNILISNWLWNDVVRANRFEHTYWIVSYNLIVMVIIFAICCLIDLIRQLVFGKLELKITSVLAKPKFWNWFKLKGVKA